MSRKTATAQRGAGAPPGMRPLRGRQAVAGVSSAARSRFAGPSGDALGRPRAQHGDASAGREQAPPAQPVVATDASRSRPPERTRLATTTPLSSGVRVSRGNPVVTGELPQAADGMTRQFYST